MIRDRSGDAQRAYVGSFATTLEFEWEPFGMMLFVVTPLLLRVELTLSLRVTTLKADCLRRGRVAAVAAAVAAVVARGGISGELLVELEIE